MKTTDKYKCGHDMTQPLYCRGEKRKRYLKITNCASCALQKVIHDSRALSTRSPMTGKPYSLGELALRFIQHVRKEQIAIRLRAAK